MTYKKYRIVRGAYQGTIDDRLDRWYIDAPETEYMDRRGAGFRTIAEAKKAINQQLEG